MTFLNIAVRLSECAGQNKQYFSAYILEAYYDAFMIFVNRMFSCSFVPKIKLLNEKEKDYPKSCIVPNSNLSFF